MKCVGGRAFSLFHSSAYLPIYSSSTSCCLPLPPSASLCLSLYRSVNATGAVANLATNAEYKQRIVAEGGLDPMIALTRSRYDKAWFHSCRGLFALAADDGNKLLIVKAGGLRPLVERLSDDAGTHVQWYAAGAVANLAIHPDLKLRIAEEGGLQRLIALAHSDNERVVRQVVRGLFALAAKTEVRHLMVDLMVEADEHLYNIQCTRS